ncbi:hypothetical protein CDAR_445821 [Caerostris darwini]|uniref:Uncharacterized protein n=1 Tax=Caerostris darwini TaxID=1538125 RepID=A0AAV4U0E8_9ARAC|nr:hypothetical protein CDAR_445821 [Caerostris darwini]
MGRGKLPPDEAWRRLESARRSRQKPDEKTRLRTADPPEDDEPRLERGPDPWNFAAQIDWEGDDDGYQCSKVISRCPVDGQVA